VHASNLEEALVAQTKRPPEGGLSAALIGAVGSGYTKRALASAVRRRAYADEAENHHGPGGGFGDAAGYGIIPDGFQHQVFKAGFAKDRRRTAIEGILDLAGTNAREIPVVASPTGLVELGDAGRATIHRKPSDLTLVGRVTWGAVYVGDSGAGRLVAIKIEATERRVGIAGAKR
jgi:hypothetical protein